MTTSTRNGLLKTLDTFTRAWRSDDRDKLADAFALDATFQSNTHGALSGVSNIAARLRSDFSRASPPRLVSTNRYVAGNDAQATLTAYLSGVLADDETESAAVFGAILLGELRHSDDR